MICEYCRGKYDIIYGSGRFCSKECAKGFSTKAKRGEINKKLSQKLKGRPNLRKGIKIGSCVSRGVDYNKALNTKKVNFVKNNHLYIERWLNGLETGIVGAVKKRLSPIVKEYLLIINNFSCSICGWNKENPIVKRCLLEFHHKDGNKLNNKSENIELLCPNCHSLTVNFSNVKYFNPYVVTYLNPDNINKQNERSPNKESSNKNYKRARQK